MNHSYKPYIKAYLLFGIISAVLVFVIGIPISAIVLLVCRLGGWDFKHVSWLLPYVRVSLSWIIGYFVFRYAIKRFVERNDNSPGDSVSVKPTESEVQTMGDDAGNDGK